MAIRSVVFQRMIGKFETTSSYIASYSNATNSSIPLAHCYQLQIVAAFCTFLFFAGILFNASLIWLFFANKELRNSLNTFIIALTSLNLFGTVFELPWIIVSNYYCEWIFGQYGCVTSAYIMYTIGCSSIYMFVAISFERFYIIYRPLSIRKINTKLKILTITGCLVVGLFWASMPLIGWSHYSLEGAETSCSVEWKERSFNVTSYNITIFSVVYLIPLICIVITNLKLISLVRNMPKNLTVDAKNKKRIASERYMTIIIIFTIIVFILCWTPYALVSMYSAFIDANGVSPLLGTIPAVFAKSSMLWTSLIFVMSNRHIRVKLYSTLAAIFCVCCRNSVDLDNSSPNNLSREQSAPKSSKNG